VSIPSFQAFVAVCQSGSVRAAAAQLNITQSGVSRRLQELQAQLDVTLFVPDGRGVRPTQTALELLPAARAAIDAYDGVFTAARRAPTQPQPLRIAATPQSIERFVSPALARCDLSVLTPRLIETGGAAVIDVVAQGQADVGLTAHPPFEAGLRRAPIGMLDLVAVPPRSAMTAFPSGTVTVAELSKQNLLVLHHHFQSRLMLEAAFNLEGIRPQIAFEGQSVRAILSLVDAGMGWAVIPSSAVGDQPVLRVMSLGQPIQMALTLIWSHAIATTPMLAEFRTQVTANRGATRAD
jgi:DNA-binding transcriptional LysR family regulator